jgi:hypothetical protein
MWRAHLVSLHHVRDLSAHLLLHLRHAPLVGHASHAERRRGGCIERVRFFGNERCAARRATRSPGTNATACEPGAHARGLHHAGVTHPRRLRRWRGKHAKGHRSSSEEGMTWWCRGVKKLAKQLPVSLDKLYLELTEYVYAL